MLTEEDFAFAKAPPSKKARESGKQEAKKSSSQDSQSTASQNRFGISLIYKTCIVKTIATLVIHESMLTGNVADMILDVNHVSSYQELI